MVIKTIRKTVLMILNLDKLLQEYDTYVKIGFRVMENSDNESECVGPTTTWLFLFTSKTHTNTDQYT
jgi:hypothetical protein